MDIDSQIIITITLTPTLQGYRINVDQRPIDAFADQIAEACRRAASFIEREILANRLRQLPQGPRLIG